MENTANTPQGNLGEAPTDKPGEALTDNPGDTGNGNTGPTADDVARAALLEQLGTLSPEELARIVKKKDPQGGSTDAPPTPPTGLITRDRVVREIGFQNKRKTAAITALLARTAHRSLLLRAGKNRSIKWDRPTNLEAMLIGLTGDAATPECKSCQGGAGPFTGCFAIPDVAGGSCHNCHYNSEGARCSFRGATPKKNKRGAKDLGRRTAKVARRDELSPSVESVEAAPGPAHNPMGFAGMPGYPFYPPPWGAGNPYMPGGFPHNPYNPATNASPAPATPPTHVARSHRKKTRPLQRTLGELLEEFNLTARDFRTISDVTLRLSEILKEAGDEAEEAEEEEDF